MAAVSMEAPTSEERMQDRVLRALQVAAVSGYYSGSSLAKSCLGVCNTCREGAPWKGMRVQQTVPLSLWPVFLPNALERWPTVGETSRVLLPRRVRKIVWIFDTMDENEKKLEAAIHLATTRDEDGVHQSEGDVEKALDTASGPLGLGKADLRRVRFPEGIEEMHLLGFDKPIKGVIWPSGLERLSFVALGAPRPYLIQSLFNHPLDGVSFPSGLREMFLGDKFDQPLENVVWPQGLERLSLPGFRQSIDNVRWPPALKSLEFLRPEEIELRKTPKVHADYLDFSLVGFNSRFTTLPASLETLWLSDDFNKSLEGVLWPSGLSTLGLGVGFRSSFMNEVSWPPSLERLYACSTDEAEGIPQGCTVSVVMNYDLDSEGGYYHFDHPYSYDPLRPNDLTYDDFDW